MSVYIQLIKIFNYFKNIVDNRKANTLDSYSFGLFIHYICKVIEGHNRSFIYHCFKYLTFCLTVHTLLFRGSQNLLYENLETICDFIVKYVFSCIFKKKKNNKVQKKN